MSATKKPRYVTYHGNAGYVALGSDLIMDDQEYPRSTYPFMLYAARLAGAVEGRYWGSVQGYDGAGISGGLLHHVAWYPRGTNLGSFWSLMNEVANQGCPHFAEALYRLGVDFDPLGRPKDWRTHTIFKDKRLLAKQIFGADNPKVIPKTNDNEALFLAARKDLSDPRSFSVQEDYAIRWLLKGRKALETQAVETMVRDLPKHFDPAWLTRDVVGDNVALALIVYHSFSVNSPTKAARILDSVKTMSNPANMLIRRLRADSPRWEKRYQRTRREILASCQDPKDLAYLESNLPA